MGFMDIDVFDPFDEKPKRKKPRKSIKDEALVRQNYKCYNCKNPLPAVKHFHHKKPVSKGGKNTVSNLFALCPNCHSDHHHRERVRTANRNATRRNDPFDIW
jgi:5-methylcytosine-specific restriction endonuclease McrA